MIRPILMHGAGTLTLLAGTFLAGMAGCLGPGAQRAQLTLETLGGESSRPLDVTGASAHVLVFVTTDCPIANGYAPEFRRLVADYGDRGARFFLVHVDRDLELGKAITHAEDYDLPRPVLVDRDHALVQWSGAEVTPECVVVLPGEKIAYQGRVNDLYADLGQKRPSGARSHDLRNALDDVLAGRPVRVSRTEAVGCYIPE